jgi:hypothetical protein
MVEGVSEEVSEGGVVKEVWPRGCGQGGVPGVSEGVVVKEV